MFLRECLWLVCIILAEFLYAIQKKCNFAHIYIQCAINTMAVSKTRAKLVDVARQLFARNGVNETTMNDIALASKKGRRTLYTYFKSKEEIYMAVVESELEMLSDALDKVAEENISPDLKILKMIETHLDTIKLIVLRNGTLRASFFRDVWRVERVRREFNKREINLFRQILTEG